MNRDAAAIEKTTAGLLESHPGEGSLLAALYDAGLAWVHFPEGFGGIGAPAPLQQAVDTVLRDAGRMPDWERNPMGVGMIAPAIAAHGTQDQRRRWLRPIFTAEEQWCQLFSEPDAGSDLAAVTTKATVVEGGWILTGQKVWTSNAPGSAWGLVLARSDADVAKHAGMTAFVIDMSEPGVEVGPIREMTGEERFSQVFLTDVFVPDDHVLGRPGEGWTVARTVLGSERTSIGGAVDDAGSGEFGSLRDAWITAGRPRPRREEVTGRWIASEVLRLTKLRLRHADSSGSGPEGAMLKLLESRHVQRTRALAVDLLGADSTLAELPGNDDDAVHRFLLGQANTIAGGTSEIIRDLVAERILELPRSR